jgi:ADP-ribose diphosphatase
MAISDRLYQSRYYALWTNEEGQEFVSARNEALVVPLTPEGDVLMTIEPSVAFDEPVLILPGGGVEQEEEPSETATRELQEEIGYRPGRLDFLGEVRGFSKYLTVRSFIYLGRDLTASCLKGDEKHPISIERVPLSMFENWIMVGRLLDARVIAALYLTKSFLCRHAL